MKINTGFSTAQSLPQKKNSVTIATNLIRSKVMLDAQGNHIDMRTKQIIKKAE